MEKSELKKHLMRLWKDTFHDPDEYISLVFDNYFDEDFVEYHVEGGVPVAGLLAVPYEFGNAEYKIKGAYLCGLATRSEYRSRGIMSRMIERICKRMSEKGFAFVFLIPANDGLRKFYHDRKFTNAFYRDYIRYVSNHNFTNEYYSIIENKDNLLLEDRKKIYSDITVYRIENMDNNYIYTYENNIKDIDNIISYIIDKESKQNGIKIFQNNINLEIVIKENIISRDRIYYCKNIDDEIIGVAFVVLENDEIIIKQILTDDDASYYKILHAVKSDYRDYGLKIFLYPDSLKRVGVWVHYYDGFSESMPLIPEISEVESSYTASENSEIYGMARILDIHEILKFMNSERRDLKFSILVKEENSGKIVNYRAKNGLVEKREMSEDEYAPNEVMSEIELASLIFRSTKKSSTILTEVMGIPPAEGWISLMLD